jgi:hypothetical protein
MLCSGKVVRHPWKGQESCRYRKSGQIRRDQGTQNHSKHRGSLEHRHQHFAALKEPQCVGDDLEVLQQRQDVATKLVIEALMEE